MSVPAASPRSQGPSRHLLAVGAALFALGLLLPPGDPPWHSFWREWTCAGGLLLAALGLLRAMACDSHAWVIPRRGLHLPALLLVLLAVLQPLWLPAGMRIHLQDQIMFGVYAGGFALWVLLGRSAPPVWRQALADDLAWAVLGAAGASALLAIGQVMGWVLNDQGLPALQLGRPGAHMEQANLLASLLIQGLLALWRLRARNRLPGWAVWPMALLLGMALGLTRSRMALLVLALAAGLLPWQAWRRPAWRPALRGAGLAAAGLLALVLALQVALPWLQAGPNGTLAVPPASASASASAPPSAPATAPGIESLGVRLGNGDRLAIWRLFADAVGRHPWLGWGALHTGPAQYAVALDHASPFWVFSGAHQMVLDLALWFGLPAALLVSAWLVAALCRRLAQPDDLPAWIAALSAGALLVHAQVELPLHYLYFLWPLGWWLGLSTPAAAAASAPAAWRLRLPRPGGLALGALAVAALMALAARGYGALSDNRPVLALDRATGVLLLSTSMPLPAAPGFDQLSEVHRFAAAAPAAPMSLAALQASQQLAERTPFVPMLERQALLLGLHGQAAAAQQVLRRACRFGDDRAGLRAWLDWQAWRTQWPQLPAWPEDASTGLPGLPTAAQAGRAMQARQQARAAAAAAASAAQGHQR